MQSYRLSIFLLAIFSTNSNADSWATFSEHNKMSGYLIAEVGEARKLDPPINTRWVQDVYQFNGHCFTSLGYFWFGAKPALLLVNDKKQIKLALLETSFSSIKVEVDSIMLVECPSTAMPYSDDPQEMFRLLEQRQKELQRQLDAIPK